MTTFGCLLSCEEFTPEQLIEQARLAEQAGFTRLAVSDHYHPWLDAQGESSFVWSVIGALSQLTALPIMTMVTCPGIRIHPAVTAQAAATSGVLCGGRFVLGVGTGEALNEHVTGARWPRWDVRAEMMEEAVEVIRELFTGKVVNHRGRHYTAEDARLYTRPEAPPPIFVSGMGPKAARLAGRIGDGLITMKPRAGLVREFQQAAPDGSRKPVVGGMKACWHQDRDKAVELALRRWPSDLLPGEINRLLPTPRHFEQAAELVTPEMVAKGIVCGADADEHLAKLGQYVEAGFDEIYVNPVGPEYRGFFDFYRDEVMPRLAPVG